MPSPKPLIIGLTGASGSGKTTFLSRLRQAFPDDLLCLISQDNYYRPREEQQQDEQGVHNFDLPQSIDQEAFLQDLQTLLRGEIVERPEYTFNNDLAESKMLRFEPRPIILLEGLFVFYQSKVEDLLDLKIYLHARETTALARRIKRDQIERNYPLEDVLYRYEHHVLPTYERYIKPLRDRADLVINNNQYFDRGLEVLSGYLRQYLALHWQIQYDVQQNHS